METFLSAMQSEFRLLKHTNGCHFARVTIEAELTPSGITITEAIREPIVEGDGEVNRKIASVWIERF